MWRISLLITEMHYNREYGEEGGRLAVGSGFRALEYLVSSCIMIESINHVRRELERDYIRI